MTAAPPPALPSDAEGFALGSEPRTWRVLFRRTDATARCELVLEAGDAIEACFLAREQMRARIGQHELFTRWQLAYFHPLT